MSLIDSTVKKAFLDELAHDVTRIARQRSIEDLRPAETKAICELILDWGYARIGVPSTLREPATALLLAKDNGVHRFAAEAFGWRIDHVQDFPSPLPEALLGPVEKSLEYKIARLRQVSFILEPLTMFDPMNAFHQDDRQRSPRPELTPLTPDERAQLRHERWYRNGMPVEFLRLLRRASVMPDELLRGYIGQWELMTDRYSTGGYFSLCAIELVDILVYAACR